MAAPAEAGGKVYDWGESRRGAGVERGFSNKIVRCGAICKEWLLCGQRMGPRRAAAGVDRRMR